jgi:hypothetical protein
MLSSKQLRSIRALRQRREQTAMVQHAKSLRAIADVDRRRAEVERTIASAQQARADLFAGLRGVMTRADLYHVKRQESYLGHQLVEAWANAQALDAERHEAVTREAGARQRVSDTHHRLAKIEHVQEKWNVQRVRAQYALEDNEEEERHHEN